MTKWVKEPKKSPIAYVYNVHVVMSNVTVDWHVATVQHGQFGQPSECCLPPPSADPVPDGRTRPRRPDRPTPRGRRRAAARVRCCGCGV